jgi:hypothetical protein
MTGGLRVPEALAVGERVEVRNRFNAQWTRGFEIVAVTDDGYTLLRVSDGEVLPSVFAPDDVRPAHKRSNDFWWMG